MTTPLSCAIIYTFRPISHAAGWRFTAEQTSGWSARDLPVARAEPGTSLSGLEPRSRWCLRRGNRWLRWLSD